MSAWTPVQQQSDRRAGVVAHRVDEEFPIATDVVLLASVDVGAAAPDVRLEQRHRRARLQRRTVHRNGNGHQPRVGGDVEQLAAIGPPAWLDPATVRDLPLTGSWRI